MGVINKKGETICSAVRASGMNYILMKDVSSCLVTVKTHTDDQRLHFNGGRVFVSHDGQDTHRWSVVTF